MPDIPDYVQKILDDFKQTLVQRIDAAQSALADLNMMERRYGLDETTMANLDIGSAPFESGPRENRSENRSVAPAKAASVSTGTFVGIAPLEAAKRYIDLVRRAVEFDEIAEAIVKGNAAIPQGSGWRDDLDMRLSRSPDVLKIAEHTYGLTKHYTPEQVAAARNARRPTPSKKAKKRKRTNKAPSSKPSANVEKRPSGLKLLETPPKESSGGMEPPKVAPERARDTSGA